MYLKQVYGSIREQEQKKSCDRQNRMINFLKQVNRLRNVASKQDERERLGEGMMNDLFKYTNSSSGGGEGSPFVSNIRCCRCRSISAKIVRSTCTKPGLPFCLLKSLRAVDSYCAMIFGYMADVLCIPGTW